MGSSTRAARPTPSPVGAALLRHALALALVLASAGAADADSIIRTSAVSSVVEAMTDGSYRYEFTVQNTSPAGQQVWPLIIDFEIPIDHPDEVWDIGYPDPSWSHEILSAADYELSFGVSNPFGSAYILHWYDMFPPSFAPDPKDDEEPEPTEETQPEPEEVEDEKAIAPADYAGPHIVFTFEADGFVLTSNQAPIDGPYLTSWTDEVWNIGDPPLPGGLISGGGANPYSHAVPLPAPAGLVLVGLGFAVLSGLIRRRHRA